MTDKELRLKVHDLFEQGASDEEIRNVGKQFNVDFNYNNEYRMTTEDFFMLNKYIESGMDKDLVLKDFAEDTENEYDFVNEQYNKRMAQTLRFYDSVHDMYNKLKSKRNMIVLLRQEYLNYSEVGKILGMTRQQVKTTLKRADDVIEAYENVF